MEIENKKFFIKQGLSWEVLETFEDNYFDFVYLDAAHDYVSVKKDIDVLLRKVKNGGIIQFNDYTIFFTNEIGLGGGQCGVVRAVDEMLIASKHEILYFCLHPYGYHDVVVKINK